MVLNVCVCVCSCSQMCVLPRYVVQQPALCSQLSSALSMSLITDPTQRKKGVRRKRKGPAAVVICTQHLGKDVQDVRRKETKKRAKMGGVGTGG